MQHTFSGGAEGGWAAPFPAGSYTVPFVIERTGGVERSYDIYSRLLRDRIVFLGTGITDAVANLVVAQLLFLETSDPEKDINLYIHSPGGSVTAGLAIYDTMQHIRCRVNTFCVGAAASMAAVLFAAGTGERYVLPNARLMIHQPHVSRSDGGIGGQVTDIEIYTRELSRMKRRLAEILAYHTGQPVERILADFERDFWMSAEEAVAYGLATKVLIPARKAQGQPELPPGSPGA